MEQIKTIRLYGQLGAKFGRVHRLAVHSAKEAVKALCFTIDGFQAFVSNSEDQGFGYSVFYDKQSVSDADLNDPVGSREIRIAPVIMGSKKAGMFQVIMGAAMIAAAVFTGGAGLALISSSTAWGIGLSGALMVTGGLFQVMSPQQTGLKSRQDAENKPSYAIGGAVNSVAMGNVVGLNYGTNEIGGAVIGVELVAENV